MRQTSEGQGGSKGKRVGKAKQLFIYGKRNLLKSVEIKTNFIIYLFRYHFVCNAHTQTHTTEKKEREGRRCKNLNLDRNSASWPRSFFLSSFNPSRTQHLWTKPKGLNRKVTVPRSRPCPEVCYTHTRAVHIKVIVALRYILLPSNSLPRRDCD